MTNTLRAVFLDHPSLDLGDLDLNPLRRCFGELQLWSETSPENLIERLQGAHVAISNKILLDARTLAACPELKLILVAATGPQTATMRSTRPSRTPSSRPASRWVCHRRTRRNSWSARLAA